MEAAPRPSAAVPRRAYGETPVELSVIGFGGIVIANAGQRHANRVVAQAVERGVNYFDVAPTYGVDNLKDKLAAGELVAAEAWSGDHLVILDRIEELGNSDKIDLQYALPSGSNWAVDMMCVPANAKNVEGAHAFINFMYDPDVAFANCDYVGYSTPNVAAREMLDDEIKNNKNYYPDTETFATLELFFSSAEIEETYSELWNTVKASS